MTKVIKMYTRNEIVELILTPTLGNVDMLDLKFRERITKRISDQSDDDLLNLFFNYTGLRLEKITTDMYTIQKSFNYKSGGSRTTKCIWY